jgi:hypothetical protein
MKEKSRRPYDDGRTDAEQKAQPPGFGKDTWTAGPTTTDDEPEGLAQAQEMNLDPDSKVLEANVGRCSSNCRLQNLG